MKKFFAAAAAFLLSLGAYAQSAAIPNPVTYSWNLTATGAAAPYLMFTAPTNNYKVDVYVSGTVPSACTFEVQSSPDGVHWNSGTMSDTGSQSCAFAALQTVNVTFKPAQYLRLNVTSLTGADGTTYINFFFTRKRDAQ